MLTELLGGAGGQRHCFKSKMEFLEKSVTELQLLPSISKFGCILCCTVKKMFNGSLTTDTGYCKNINYCYLTDGICWQNKSFEQILINFSGIYDNGPRKILLNFDDVLDSGGSLTFDLQLPRCFDHKAVYDIILCNLISPLPIIYCCCVCVHVCMCM